MQCRIHIWDCTLTLFITSLYAFSAHNISFFIKALHKGNLTQRISSVSNWSINGKVMMPRPWIPLLLVISYFFETCSGLHFYASVDDTKCFYEELPKGSLVVGKFDAYVNTNGVYEPSSMLSLAITVDETFDNDHRVVSQRSASSGDFTFSALDSGEHKFCITPKYADKKTKIRIFFDLVLAGEEVIDSKRKDEVSVLTNKIKQLNNKVQEIQREQKLMREREASFRDQSESTNSKVVRWSVIQLLVLLATCALQLKYLKSFFIKQKVL